MFDPQDPAGGEGDDLDLGGTPTGPSGEVVGRGNGPSQSGGSYVPLSEAFDRYRQQATAALDRGELSPASRTLVAAYFDTLSGGP